MKRTVRIRIRRVRVTGPAVPEGASPVAEATDLLDLEAGPLRELFLSSEGRVVRRSVARIPPAEPDEKT